VQRARCMKLRKILWTIATSASLSGCCIQDSWWEDESYVMPATADGTLGEVIAKCRANNDCEPLCTHHWLYLSDSNPEGDSEVRNCERDGDKVTYEGYATCVAGRRPAHHRCVSARGTAVGRYLAVQAALEAASVRAFADLFADLVAHDAPQSLRRATIRAAADEIRHAQLCAHLARRHGAQLAPSASPAAARRTLRELAIDNVVEGCIRETFGAVVAAYQARAAADPAIRTVMHTIAGDETMHAQLAWQIHAWLTPKLSDNDRDVVADAARRARAELHGAPDVDTVRIAGIPDATVQRELLAALDASVWSRLSPDSRSAL
jgi:hypothetical protein